VWDEFSVGMTLLEVFFGTDVVAALKSIDAVRMLMKESRRYLSEDANGVLLQLFYFTLEPGEPEITLTPRAYLRDVLEVDQEHVRENILRASVAIEESSLIKDLLPVRKVQPTSALEHDANEEGGALGESTIV
jgi:hypothetical protein